jgi:hypothetical protein
MIQGWELNRIIWLGSLSGLFATVRSGVLGVESILEHCH